MTVPSRRWLGFAISVPWEEQCKAFNENKCKMISGAKEKRKKKDPFNIYNWRENEKHQSNNYITLYLHLL
jgi:hypothetical protein